MEGDDALCIFPGSFDPVHKAHLRTWNEAEKKYGPVFLVICRNTAKGEGLFNLEERKEIAELFLPPDRILIADTPGLLLHYFKQAKKIVRGFRNQDEIYEMAASAQLHGVSQFSSKLVLLRVPEELVIISSTKLRELVKNGDEQIAKEWSSSAVVRRIKEHLNS